MNLIAECNTSRYSTTYGTIADAFDVYHLLCSYNYRQFTVSTGIQNLLDKNYAYTEGFPAPGRNFFLKLLFELNNSAIK